MRFFSTLALIPVFLGLATISRGQSYPVRVTTQLTPPYSLKLSDYSSAVTDRVVFTIFADVSRPEVQVKFKLTIEGQNIVLSTSANYNPPPVTLRGGIPERLTGLDLADYFHPNNLVFQGITRQQFERTGVLPEGLYRFQLEVLEYNRGVKISNGGTANAWLILNDPPVVNLPRQNEKLKARSPQNVVLQWTPRHTGSPNSAFSTEYDVKMVEVWPASRNPNDAILTSPPIFETTTRNTTLIYGPEETPLEPGRHYAFQIRARSISGVEEMDLFKNNGKSEVVSFIYGDACDLPTGVNAKVISSSRFAVGWDGLFNHTAYKVRYREAGNANANWYETNTVLTETEIVSLKPNTKYEYQVAGVCGPFDGPYTTVATIATAEMPPTPYSCGLPVSPIVIDPSSLIASLKVGDVIEAGDFTVTLTRVSGANGTFSGEGVLEVPYLKNAKVAASFTNIMVSQQLRMVNGHMNVTGAALDIVPDEITAKLGELNETLDELDAVLGQAEDVLDDIDAVLNVAQQVLDEVMYYLPEDIVQEINTARADISSAKARVSAATTDEEKAEAKAEVKAGRDKLKNAAGRALEYYAEVVEDIFEIVKAAAQEVVNEVTDKIEASNDSLHSEKTVIAENAELQRAERAAVAINGGNSNEDVGYVFAIPLTSNSRPITVEEEDRIKAQSPSKAQLLESINNVVRIGRPLIRWILMNEKLKAIVQGGQPELKKFVDDLKVRSEDVLRAVLEDLKRNRKGDAQAKVKDYIITTFN